jgi:hypothetical protein
MSGLHCFLATDLRISWDAVYDQFSNSMNVSNLQTIPYS